jgi:hypothetical protein
MAMNRNLLVHCYPRLSGKWRRTLAHLTAGIRWAQFTGRKIVTVAYDQCCEDPDDVCSQWPAECEFIVKRNVPGLQEVASFLPMLEMVESRDPDECTTYVHCKGCTQPDGHGSHGWLDFMAQANLDYPELVECALSRANICGAFRSHGLWAFPGYHNWHYAGTWFTFRHSRIFGELDWRNVHQDFMGVEAWPGIVPLAESACLFYDGANTAHLYSPDFQRDNIAPAMKWWHKSLQKCGLVPASLGGVCTVNQV